MKSFAKVIGGVVVLTAVGCGGDNATNIGSPSYGGDILNNNQRQQIATAATKALGEGIAPKVTAGMNDFGFNLLQKLNKASGPKNICISPVSAASVLTMLYNGAGGDTQKQIAQSLSLAKFSPDQINEATKNVRAVLGNVDPDQVKMTVADSIWVRSGITLNPEFAKKNTDTFNAKIATIDFASKDAPSTINGWVNEQTSGKIPTLVDKISDGARLYALDAVYFKGPWKQAFDKSRTQSQDFALADGKKVQVPMMSQAGSFKYFNNSDASGVVLPYGSGRLEMVVILPGGKQDIEKVEKKLAASFPNWLKDAAPKQVTVKLPTFRADYEAGLVESLKGLGITSAFDPTKANFDGIVSKEGAGLKEKLYLSEVKQKTFINVDEKGTEAAAATSGIISATAMPLTVSFSADRPFLYVIRDSQTGVVLFEGAMYDPQAAPAVAEVKSGSDPAAPKTASGK